MSHESSIQVLPPDLPPITLEQLHSSITMNPLREVWVDQTHLERIRLSKLFNSANLSVSRCLVIENDLSWKAYVYGNEVKANPHSPLQNIPDHLDLESFEHLIMHVISVLEIQIAVSCPCVRTEKANFCL